MGALDLERWEYPTYRSCVESLLGLHMASPETDQDRVREVKTAHGHSHFWHLEVTILKKYSEI